MVGSLEIIGSFREQIGSFETVRSFTWIGSLEMVGSLEIIGLLEQIVFGSFVTVRSFR